jgi:hypothetical protein
MLTESERNERHRRLRRFERLERWKVLGALLAAVTLAAFVVWSLRLWEPHGGRSSSAALCAADYKRARNATDSAIVDRRQPVVFPDDALARLTCGELRRAGKVRP